MYAWAEAYAPQLGWVAFDPAQNVCPGPSYVRVAVGFDGQGAAACRGSYTGALDEAVSVALRIEQSQSQSQN